MEKLITDEQYNRLMGMIEGMKSDSIGIQVNAITQDNTDVDTFVDSIENTPRTAHMSDTWRSDEERKFLSVLQTPPEKELT